MDSHVYEFCRFDNAGSIQIFSVVMKFLKKLYLSTTIKVKIGPYVGNFMRKTHPYERHVQYHLTIKYPPPPRASLLDLREADYF